MLDILCIGDARIDIFLHVPSDNPHFSLDEKRENMLLEYGGKITIENYSKNIGGNASNAAIGLARLGKNVGICVQIGNDEFASFITNALEAENINTNLIKKLVSSTPFSVILSYKDERTILIESIKRKYEFNFENASAKIIYLTSLGDDWKTVYEKALDLVKNREKILAFNPGSLQIEKKDELVMDLISESDYLFVNKEEAEGLLHGNGSNLLEEQKQIKKTLFGLKSLGAKNVIITDAENGIYAHSEKNEYLHLDIIKVDVVEKTGAGDAFNAGFIAAILEGKGIQDALIWGSINASSVIQKTGAQNGLLKKEELLEKLNTLGKYIVLPL